MRKRQRKKLEHGTRRRTRRLQLRLNRCIAALMTEPAKRATRDAIDYFDSVGWVVYACDFVDDDQ